MPAQRLFGSSSALDFLIFPKYKQILFAFHGNLYCVSSVEIGETIILLKKLHNKNTTN